MNFRDELARIIAGDPRYSIEAYAFVLEALNHAKHQKLKGKVRGTRQGRSHTLTPTATAGRRHRRRRNRAFRATSPVASCARPSEDWPCASTDCSRRPCSIIGEFGRLPISVISFTT